MCATSVIVKPVGVSSIDACGAWDVQAWTSRSRRRTTAEETNAPIPLVWRHCVVHWRLGKNLGRLFGHASPVVAFGQLLDSSVRAPSSAACAGAW
jgi:hypothetical protein